jgi:hypothetical protein
MSKYNYLQDGNMICATLPGFVDIQESPCGFGETEEKATINLLEGLVKEARTIIDEAYDEFSNWAPVRNKAAKWLAKVAHDEE